jgi:hypothetical protein
MNKKYLYLTVIASVIFLGAGCANKQSAPTNANVNAEAVNTTTESAETATSTEETAAPANTNTNTAAKPATTKSKTTTPATKTSFYVELDDKGFYPGSGTARKDSTVTITFKARTSNVIYNGLEVRANRYDLGYIKGGASKSVSFPAEGNITFSSFWPSGAYRGAWTLYVK